jgi:ribosomal protein S10
MSAANDILKDSKTVNINKNNINKDQNKKGGISKEKFEENTYKRLMDHHETKQAQL